MAWVFAQIASLVLIVFGGIVAICAPLPDRTRKICVLVFVILGAANLISIVITNETTTGSPHLSDLAPLTKTIIAKGKSSVVEISESREFQLIFVLVLGLSLGYLGPREYRRAFGYRWYSSYDIFKLANQKLLTDAVIAEDQIQQLAAKIIALSHERQELGLVPCLVPHATSDALATLQASISEASARNFALHELREKSRARAREDIYAKLRDGRLIAKGFVAPAGSTSKEMIIAAGHWKFIKFSGDYTEASNNNVRYVGIEVARRRWF